MVLTRLGPELNTRDTPQNPGAMVPGSVAGIDHGGRGKMCAGEEDVAVILNGGVKLSARAAQAASLLFAATLRGSPPMQAGMVCTSVWPGSISWRMLCLLTGRHKM